MQSLWYSEWHMQMDVHDPGSKISIHLSTLEDIDAKDGTIIDNFILVASFLW